MERATCPTCGTEIEADDPHGLCPHCLLATAEKSMRCKACQRELSADARFCAGCGTPAPAASEVSQGDRVRTALDAKLQGQYRVVRLLGRGGMGSVYLARDLTLDREVAVKVVNTSSDASELHDRFRREARTAARLSHPNIVPLHSFGEVEGMPYFVMGYVRGESLAARLRRDGKLPEEEVRRILGEIADALDHAHRQGVIHRDIKPDNVLLDDESGRALLTDFGIAKALGKGETLTRSGDVVGTPHFMSPEQAAGHSDIDARSDLYSLGVMGYMMLTGRLPFEGSTPGEVLRKHLTQEPPPLRSLAATVSDSTLQAVERCLAKDPARRWPDARSLKLAVGAVEEAQLPDALQAIQSQGVTFVSVAAALLLLVWVIVVRLQGAPIGVLGINVAVVVVGYMLIIAHLRFEGIPVAQTQRVIWTEPAWWPLWYPRSLRRPGNVWDRLPGGVRRARSALPLFITGVVVWMYWFVAGTRSASFDPRRFVITNAIALGVGFGLAFLVEIPVKRELRRKGLAGADVTRVMTIPASRVSFWNRPYIAAILSPAKSQPTQRAGSVHDHLQSILRQADELSGPLRPIGREAVVAARQVMASIDDADRQIAELARNLEPGEEERLAAKIEALAAAPGRDDEYAPMRALLEKQIELIRGLSARIEQVRESRSRRVEMLRNLDLHLASLRARSTEQSSELVSVTDRVRALCEEIGRQSVPAVEGNAAAAAKIDQPTTVTTDRR